MPKLKVAKKISKKTVKKSPLKKVTSKVAPVTHKKRSLLFRLGIAVLLTFLAVSLYQVYAYGTGPLSFLAGKSDVFLVTDGGAAGGVATCNLPEAVCKTVNGCKWTAPVYVEQQVACSPAQCKSGAHNCSGKNVTTNKTVEICEDGVSTLSKCKQLGFDTIKSVKPVTTYICNDSYTEDVLQKAGGCSGTPIVAPVAASVLPPANAYIPTQSMAPIPDYCKSACTGNVNSDACKSCLANSYKACCTIEKNSPSCEVCVAGTNNPACLDKDRNLLKSVSIRQTKHTVVNIISSRDSCGAGTSTCTAQLKPNAGTVKGSSVCVGGRGGGSTLKQANDPLSACKNTYGVLFQDSDSKGVIGSFDSCANIGYPALSIYPNELGRAWYWDNCALKIFGKCTGGEKSVKCCGTTAAKTKAPTNACSGKKILISAQPIKNFDPSTLSDLKQRFAGLDVSLDANNKLIVKVGTSTVSMPQGATCQFNKKSNCYTPLALDVQEISGLALSATTDGCEIGKQKGGYCCP